MTPERYDRLRFRLGQARILRSTPGWIYFVTDETAIKIGFSRRPITGDSQCRLRALQTGNPRPLRLVVDVPGRIREEKALHEALSDVRLVGEWFAITEAEAREIALSLTSPA